MPTWHLSQELSQERPNSPRCPPANQGAASVWGPRLLWGALCGEWDTADFVLLWRKVEPEVHRGPPPGAVPGVSRGHSQQAAAGDGDSFLLDLERFGVLEQLWPSWPSGMGPMYRGTGEAALSPHSGHRTLLHGSQCLAETD